jgi:anti-sigma regulatory factor (Ser/Thr protein kinase)
MEERLSLQVDISQIAQVPSWIERLSTRYGIPGKVQFASNLCLEEVLSNIILHGYGSSGRGDLLVRFVAPRPGCFVFIVEDEAPHFNPLEQPELPALNPNEEMRVGGQGLRFLREFASSLEYERLPVGNRFKMFFLSEAFGRNSDTC